MIYNKTEQRVGSYVELLRKYCFREAGVSLDFKVSQHVQHKEEQLTAPVSIKAYPYLFGKEEEDTWFEAEVEIPEEEIFLEFPLKTDCLMNINGHPAFNHNFKHPIHTLSAYRGQKVSLCAVCWDGYVFPGWMPIDGERVMTSVGDLQKSYPIILDQPRLLYRNKAQYELWYDLFALYETLLTLPKDSLFREQGMSRLHDALMCVSLVEEDLGKRETQAQKADLVVKELLANTNGSFSPSVSIVGMAHLDHAWLWPKEETFRKSVRTISGMLTLMEEFPEFKFLCTQPVQMERTFQNHPDLYEKAKKAYERGQFDPNGVALIESDNMLSSGEGLIRGFLYGRQVTGELFPDYEGDSYVVPDSFGYNGNLPQIMAGCGVAYFITSKLGWNDTNRFPFDTFHWKGIDGSVVKAHMIQLSYNGQAKPSYIVESWDHVQHKDVQRELLMTIGEGDGGGGTSREDIETARRITNLQGCPRTEWRTVSEAMKRIFTSSRNIPTFTGEQYFELHRGTYTTQAKMKQYYRRMTAALHNTEYLIAASWASHRLSDMRKEELSDEVKAMWKETVINQFHDILPGSSVGCVYEETNAFYQNALARLADIMQELSTKEEGKMMNLTPFPASGIAPYSAGTCPSPVPDMDGKPAWGSVLVSDDGTISSVSIAGRELVAEGGWNALMLGEDVPLCWDAWDIEKDSMDLLQAVSVPMDKNYIRKGRIGKSSTITQQIVIHQEEAIIDFNTEIDWHEDHQLLRAQFPVALEASHAIYDIPFGYVERSTRSNTTIERAQFESPAQKFVSISDQKLTVALMSDSKYGYSAKDGVLSISLLRSPKAPDPNADMGRHHFHYSIVITDKGIGDIIEKAERLNNPLLPLSIPEKALVSVSSGLSFEMAKISEDRSGIIFRVREYLGIGGVGKLTLSGTLDASTLIQTNMIEKPLAKGSMYFRPFEVKTFYVKRCSGRISDL